MKWASGLLHQRLPASPPRIEGQYCGIMNFRISSCASRAIQRNNCQFCDLVIKCNMSKIQLSEAIALLRDLNIFCLGVGNHKGMYTYNLCDTPAYDNICGFHILLNLVLESATHLKIGYSYMRSVVSRFSTERQWFDLRIRSHNGSLYDKLAVRCHKWNCSTPSSNLK